MIPIILQRKATWRVEDEEKVKKNFHTKVSHTLSQMFKVVHQEGKQQEWIDNSLCELILELFICLVTLYLDLDFRTNIGGKPKENSHWTLT